MLPSSPLFILILIPPRPHPLSFQVGPAVEQGQLTSALSMEIGGKFQSTEGDKKKKIQVGLFWRSPPLLRASEHHKLKNIRE